MRVRDPLIISSALVATAANGQVWSPDLPALAVSDTKRYELDIRVVDHMDVPVWATAVEIGTPPQRLHVCVDLWTQESQVITYNERRDLPFYNHTLSSTFRANGTHISSVLVNGDTARDRWVFPGRHGSLPVENMLFVEVSDESFQRNPEYQGSFGFGYGTSAITGVPSAMETLIQRGALDQPVIGVSFDKSGDGGRMVVGGVDETRFRGPITYVDIQQSKWADWRLPFGGLTVGDVQIPPIAAQSVVFTDGMSINAPVEQVQAIADALGADIFVLPCDKPLPDITVQVGDFKLVLTKDLYLRRERGVCLLALLDDSGDPTWYVGLGAIPHLYTVFDYGNSPGRERIGFAPAV